MSDEVCRMVSQGGWDGTIDKTEECGMGKLMFSNQISYRHLFVIPILEISGQASSAFACM